MSPGDSGWPMGGRGWGALIVGSTVLIYVSSLWNGFIWDDGIYITSNAAMGSLSGLLSLWSFHNPLSAFPVTMTGLWLEHWFFGSDPWGYHAVSLIWHILNAVLLWSFLRRLTLPSVAGLASLLFSIHPIQVETVAWVAEQKNLFCFFFFVLAGHAFLNFDADQKPGSYGLSLFFFTMALLSKSVAVCFVSVPLLYAWWKRGGVSWGEFGRIVPFVLLGIVGVGRPFYNEVVCSSPDLSRLLFAEKTILASKNFFFYIKQILLPWRFLTAYPAWDLKIAHYGNWFWPFAVLALYGLLYRSRERLGRGVFALLAFYGVSIFPALGFFKVSLLSMTPASDHFAYLSAPAILLMFSSLVYRILPVLRISTRRIHWVPSAQFLRIVLLALVSYLSFLTVDLTRIYRDSLALWARLYRERPLSFIANSRLGTACLGAPERCGPELTVHLLENAFKMQPEDHSIMKTLGSAYEQKGMYSKAIELFLKASKGRNPFVQAHYARKIGEIYLKQKDPVRALFYLEKDLSLQASPEYARFRHQFLRMQEDLDTGERAVYSLCGHAYFLTGDFKKAADAFRKATTVLSQETENYEGLGASLMNLGDLPGAMRAFQEAARLDPGNRNAQNNLDYVRRTLADGAREHSGDPTPRVRRDKK